MDKIRAAIAAFLAWPVIAPLLEVLNHRSVLVLLAGLIGFGLVPTIPWLSPTWAERVGNLLVVGTLLISGRFSLQGIIEAVAQIPRGSLEEMIRALITEILSQILNPTPETTTTVSGVPVGSTVTVSQSTTSAVATANTVGRSLYGVDGAAYSEIKDFSDSEPRG